MSQTTDWQKTIERSAITAFLLGAASGTFMLLAIWQHAFGETHGGLVATGCWAIAALFAVAAVRFVMRACIASGRYQDEQTELADSYDLWNHSLTIQ